jgi:hypothetical protein
LFQVSDKKIIAVVGATGALGGGPARAILADPKWRLRGAGHHQERRLRPGRGR